MDRGQSRGGGGASCGPAPPAPGRDLGLGRPAAAGSGTGACARRLPAGPPPPRAPSALLARPWRHGDGWAAASCCQVRGSREAAPGSLRGARPPSPAACPGPGPAAAPRAGPRWAWTSRGAAATPGSDGPKGDPRADRIGAPKCPAGPPGPPIQPSAPRHLNSLRPQRCGFRVLPSSKWPAPVQAAMDPSFLMTSSPAFRDTTQASFPTSQASPLRARRLYQVSVRPGLCAPAL